MDAGTVTAATVAAAPVRVRNKTRRLTFGLFVDVISARLYEIGDADERLYHHARAEELTAVKASLLFVVFTQSDPTGRC
jgi:hypothetical protein